MTGVSVEYDTSGGLKRVTFPHRGREVVASVDGGPITTGVETEPYEPDSYWRYTVEGRDAGTRFPFHPDDTRDSVRDRIIAQLDA